MSSDTIEADDSETNCVLCGEDLTTDIELDTGVCRECVQTDGGERSSSRTEQIPRTDICEDCEREILPEVTHVEGKHVTGSMPVDQCSDCGGRWFEATPERLACDRCGGQDASRVLNSEHKRLCDDCVKWENVILDAYEYDKGDVFQGMDGDFWVITSRLWNHDAVEYERSSPTGEKYETTMPWHRREYELSKLDPAAMGCDTQRVNESDLTHHFTESTKDEAQNYYEEMSS